MGLPMRTRLTTDIRGPTLVTSSTHLRQRPGACCVKISSRVGPRWGPANRLRVRARRRRRRGVRVHVVIVGCGRVGSSLARDLQAGGHTVAVVDRRRAAFERLGTPLGGTTVEGIGLHRGTLIQAGGERAPAVAPLPDRDNSTILLAPAAP